MYVDHDIHAKGRNTKSFASLSDDDDDGGNVDDDDGDTVRTVATSSAESPPLADGEGAQTRLGQLRITKSGTW